MTAISSTALRKGCLRLKRTRIWCNTFARSAIIWDAQRAQESEKDEKEEKSAVMPRRTKERELRMSYKEQKDYETIDARMEQLQGELKRLDGEIEKNASDFVKLTELTQKREQTQKELDQAEERWLYLTDLAERIEAQKKD